MCRGVLIAAALICFVVPGEDLQAADADVFAALPEPVLTFHKATTSQECDYGTTHPVGPEIAEVFNASSYEVDDRWKLYTVPCSVGAYQAFYAVYAATVDGSKIERMLFVSWGPDGPVATNELGNAVYEPETRILSSRSVFRGLGDCGTSAEYKIVADEDGLGTKVLEIRYKPDCDENDDVFPKVFSAK